MEKLDIMKINCQIYREHNNRLISILRDLGINEYHQQLAKASVLQEKKGFLLSPARTALSDDPVDFFTFYIDPAAEESVLGAIISGLELNIPGRGSVYSERMTVYRSQSAFVNTALTAPAAAQPVYMNDRLCFICCIVQRGEGNSIVASALDAGSTLPVVTYGEGTGLRNKLGLLRITIPAEKEILHMTVSQSDLKEIQNILIEAGHIDQPGKGFIYNYPVGRGLINSKIFYGKQKHVASMEQVIFAIDNITGNTEWRKRYSDSGQTKGGHTFLTGMVRMNIICNDGLITDLINAAMAAGAAGATISRSKYLRLEGENPEGIASAREMADLIISEKNVETILNALKAAGMDNPSSGGLIEVTPVTEACTYLPKK